MNSFIIETRLPVPLLVPVVGTQRFGHCWYPLLVPVAGTHCWYPEIRYPLLVPVVGTGLGGAAIVNDYGDNYYGNRGSIGAL